jgi:hypothetical protein
MSRMTKMMTICIGAVQDMWKLGKKEGSENGDQQLST